MMRPKQKTSWWLFYLVWVAMTSLLVWDYWTPWSTVWQDGCALVIVLAAYALIAAWLHANRSALQEEDQLKQQQRTMPQRTIPLSPVQAKYLTSLEQYTKR